MLAFIVVGLIASCKKGETTGPGTEPVETGPTPESTAAYFGLDSTFIYRDSVYTYSSGNTSVDTLRRVFFDGFSSGSFYLVPYKDSVYSSGQVTQDTFKIAVDTVYYPIRLRWDTIDLNVVLYYIYGIKPLSVGQTWNPLESGVYPLGDSIEFTQPCTLYFHLDSLQIDSSKAEVLSMTNVTVPAGTFNDVYQIFYGSYAKVYYHTTGCLSLSGTADLTLEDTTYLKTYYGIVKSDGFSRTSSPMVVDSARNHRVLIGR